MYFNAVQVVDTALLFMKMASQVSNINENILAQMNFDPFYSLKWIIKFMVMNNSNCYNCTC